MIKAVFFAIIFFVVANILIIRYEKPFLVISKQDSVKNFNPYIYNFISLGNKRLIADLLWVATLLESDTDHYAKKDFNNWMYLRFDSILKLDPQFLEAYQLGAQYLSIVKDDLYGAKDLYDRGLLHYPNDYFLNWNGGFHYLYELKDGKTSLHLFQKIIYHPRSPPYLPSIIAKLKAKHETKEIALKLLEESITKISFSNPQLIKKMENDIKTLKIEIDLDCLNNQKLKECSLYRPSGVDYYLDQSGKYISNWKSKRFELSTRKNKSTN